ncbi:hypothetical protein GCM10023196_039380 [Actinoallomurus vinaceus]|uniref:Glycoside hydrolase family 5 domain-containing protein n=1 Tax=Actinoallomurus vinaceus TaxID=1080074 RepID=A0ABP8UA20_9ACTN
MQVGINQPWWLYHTFGIDFGGLPRSDQRHWTHGVDAVFDSYASIGLRIVRWFIFGSGAMLLPSPRREAAGTVTAAPPIGLGRQVLDDFELLHRKARSHGLRLVPTFLDFHFAFAPEFGDRVKGGRSSWISDTAKRHALFENVLEPLLGVSASYPDTIYAWDLFNEPEWCTDVLVPPSRTVRQANVRLSDMKAFLREGCARITQHRLPATVGFNDPMTPSQWALAGPPITRTQVHHYGRITGSLITAAASEAVDGEPAPANSYGPSAFLGEFPFNVTGNYRWLRPGDRRPSSGPNSYEESLYERLQNLQPLGYDAVLGWSYPLQDHPPGPTDPEGSWPEVRADLEAFLVGSRGARTAIGRA